MNENKTTKLVELNAEELATVSGGHGGGSKGGGGGTSRRGSGAGRGAGW